MRQLVDWMRRLYGVTFPVVGSLTTTSNKQSTEVGVPSLSVEVNRGLWVVPCGDIKSHYRKRSTCGCGRCTFLRELLEYPNTSTDTVMACWHLMRAAKQSDMYASPDATTDLTGFMKKRHTESDAYSAIGRPSLAGPRTQVGDRIFTGPPGSRRRYF